MSLLSVEEDRTYFVRQLLRHITDEQYDLAKLILNARDLKDVKIDNTNAMLLHFIVRHFKQNRSLKARTRHAEITNHLIELGFNVDARNKFGNTPLMCIFLDQPTITNPLSGGLEIIKILLKAKPNLCLKNNRGLNVLQLVFKLRMRSDYEVDIIREFLKSLESTYKDDCKLMAKIAIENGCSLIRAILLNNPNLTRSMILHGCSPTARDPRTGMTALHAAVSLMSLENVKVLIEQGASVFTEDNEGQTPLQYYVENHSFHNYITKDLQKPEIVKIFMEKIGDVTKLSSRHMFIVGAVAKYGNEEAIDILLKYNIDFHVQENMEYIRNTLLHYFAENFSCNVVSLLNGKTFDPNIRGDKGDTPLVKAIWRSNSNFAQLMLENGADPNSRISYNGMESPLGIAIESWSVSQYHREEDLKNITLLLQYGANPQGYKRQSIIKACQQRKENYNVAKLPLALLALQDVLETPILDEIRQQIRANPMFQNYFDMCKRKLNKMKKVIIHKPSLTMFALMIDDKDTIVNRYSFNQEFTAKLESVNKKSHSNFYYHGLLRKRLAYIIPNIKLIQQAALVICSLISMKKSVDSIIVRKIVSYLGDADLQNLNKLECG